MRILLAGSSGFLGRRVSERLRSQGHLVRRLVRSASTATDASTWEPYAGRVDPAEIESADVVINLAGSPTAGNPHSRRWATQLRASRVETTRVLAEAIAASDRKPAFLAGNGISFYGDSDSTELTESSPSRGDAFLTQVAREWQAAADPAVEAGARVVILRTAPVMDKASAPLKPLSMLFRLGLGGRLGSGEQYMAMISSRDWVGAVSFLVEAETVSGPVNLCCMHAPTNAEFTDALASAVGRAARLAAPAPLLRVATGALGPELLGSLNVRPAALLAAGYEFSDPGVREVVAAGLA